MIVMSNYNKVNISSVCLFFLKPSDQNTSLHYSECTVIKKLKEIVNKRYMTL